MNAQNAIPDRTATPLRQLYPFSMFEEYQP